MDHSIVSYATGSVASKDGTTVGYRQVGRGPPLILVHGGMMASQNLMKLAGALGDAFTAYVPDRRGRGLSGPFDARFGIVKAVEDMQALIGSTGSTRLFGLSAGAIVTLHTALATPAIRKVAAYEPPIALAEVPGSSPLSWLPRYEQELADGKLAEAMVSALKGIGDARILSALPRFISEPLMRLALAAEAREVKDGDVALRDLIPTLLCDARIVLDTADKLDELRSISAEVLLLNGSSSPLHFRRIIHALHAALPGATRVSMPGLGHTSADNGGKPQRIADELRRFFA
jgi:pimeloyl-ACP methyl ester carboxylesterase